VYKTTHHAAVAVVFLGVSCRDNRPNRPHVDRLSDKSRGSGDCAEDGFAQMAGHQLFRSFPLCGRSSSVRGGVADIRCFVRKTGLGGLLKLFVFLIN